MNSMLKKIQLKKGEKALRISEIFVLILHITATCIQAHSSAETNKFQLTNMLFITYILKRCFECTVNGSLQMVVTVACKWL